MVPGFVDAHGHFINAVEMAGRVDVSSPPVGPVRSDNPLAIDPAKIADIQVIEAIKDGKTVHRKTP